ncbi:DUF805 domain-containing protein [bacterium]|nr:DUF805 domain-containing protein [bacterium]
MNIIKHFIDTMKTVLVTRATDINGRSDRPEYWWFTLYACIVFGLLAVVDNFVLGFTFFSILEPWGEMQESGVLVALFTLGTLVQSITLTARRLHDRGHSGWWQLMLIVPFLNFIVIYWLVRSAKDTPKYLKYKNPYGKLTK